MYDRPKFRLNKGLGLYNKHTWCFFDVRVARKAFNLSEIKCMDPHPVVCKVKFAVQRVVRGKGAIDGGKR